MPLKILVIGAGVAGSAIALLLQRTNPAHDITVIERFPSLRLGGQQLDFKLQGLPIITRMGLLETYKKHRVLESGVAFVDPHGKELASFGINNGKSKSIAITTDLEIMRGDIVKVLYDRGLADRKELEAKGQGEKGGLRYAVGKSVTELVQDTDGVDVVFSNEETARYDLVIAADGQGSRTRSLVFGKEVSDDSVNPLNVHAAYFDIPRAEGEGDMAKFYLAPGRGVMTRTGNRPVTQVYFYTANNMKETYKEPVEKQKEAWAQQFIDAGWDCKRFIDGMHKCEDFYAHEVVQIKMKNLYQGRVVLLGDAGYCPAVFSGMGTTSALIGSWVLAGELARHGDDVPTALKAYESSMQTPIAEFQQLHMPASFPSSRLLLWAFRNVVWAAGVLNIERLMGWFSSNKTEQKEVEASLKNIPKYPELESKL